MLRKNISIQHLFQDTDPIPGQFDVKINIPFTADEMIVRNIWYSKFGDGNANLLHSTVSDEIQTSVSADPYAARISTRNYTYYPPDEAEGGMSVIYFSLVNEIIGCVADYPLGHTQSSHWKLDGVTSNQFTIKLIESDGALASERRGFLVIMLEFIGYNKQ